MTATRALQSCSGDLGDEPCDSGAGTWPLTGAEASIGARKSGRGVAERPGRLVANVSPRSARVATALRVSLHPSSSVLSLPSAPCPVCRTFVGEGCHTLGLVLAREEQKNARRSNSSPADSGSSSRPEDRLLRGPDRERRLGGDAGGELEGRVERRLGGTTLRHQAACARPRAALIVRPVRISSIALALPIARVSRCVPPAPGMTPSLISGWPNWASSPATIMSQTIASSQPPPSAKPRTAAMSGVRMAAIRPQRREAAVDGQADRRLGGQLADVGAGGERAGPRAGQDDGAAAGSRSSRFERRRRARRGGRS